MSSFSYQNPFPSLTLIDKTRKEWCEVATTAEKKSVDRYIRPSFMYKVLEGSGYEIVSFLVAE